MNRNFIIFHDQKHFYTFEDLHDRCIISLGVRFITPQEVYTVQKTGSLKVGNECLNTIEQTMDVTNF